MWTWALNTAWMLKCSGEAAAFGWACRHVARAQAGVLRQIVCANRDSWFGHCHHFSAIGEPRSFQQRVPPRPEAEFTEAVGRIAAGEANVLTREPVVALAPTSGTTGGEKLIPYTAGLRRQFQRGVAAWIANLFWCRPAVRRGRAYWSISPALGPARRTSGGLPIGFDDDASYLGGLEQWALRRLLAVPGEVARLPDMATFRYWTLRFLLSADDLALLSVWNPTFLTALLSGLPDCFDRLCADIQFGSDVGGILPRPPNRARASRLRDIWRSSASLAECLREAWPALALISCWADAAAERFLPGLRELFPTVEVQPKGLLATEGFVSLPLVDRPGAVLAVRCHFFEFEDLATGRYLLAHELEPGGRYRVLLTTAGGLYRYQLRDEVEVVGFQHQCPLLRFQGRSDLVSDLVGEKLAEPHVRAVLARLPALQRPGFLLLAPVLEPSPGYHLYLQGAGLTSDLTAPLAAELQAGLEENPYYRQAVRVGQLAPVAVVLLDPEKGPAWLVYERRCLERGQKAGNVKPAVLDRWTGWPERFAPLLTAENGGKNGEG